MTVFSDAQLQLTIPAGTTTGAIGIFNPAHAAFTATSFAVQLMQSPGLGWCGLYLSDIYYTLVASTPQ